MYRIGIMDNNIKIQTIHELSGWVRFVLTICTIISCLIWAYYSLSSKLDNIQLGMKYTNKDVYDNSVGIKNNDNKIDSLKNSLISIRTPTKK